VQVGTVVYGDVTPDKIDKFFEEVVKPAAEGKPLCESVEA